MIGGAQVCYSSLRILGCLFPHPRQASGARYTTSQCILPALTPYYLRFAGAAPSVAFREGRSVNCVHAPKLTRRVVQSDACDCHARLILGLGHDSCVTGRAEPPRASSCRRSATGLISHPPSSLLFFICCLESLCICARKKEIEHFRACGRAANILFQVCYSRSPWLLF